MAYSLISAGCGAASGPGSQNTSVVVDTRGATLIVVAMQYGDPVTLADTANLTWTYLTEYVGTFVHTRLAVCVPDTTLSAHTFFLLGSTTSSVPGIAVASFAGNAAWPASLPFDQESGTASDTGATSKQPGSITPPQNDCLLVSGCWSGSTVTPSVDSGFTIAAQAPGVFGFSAGSSIAYLIQTSAAAVNPEWTAASDIHGATMISFTGTGGSAGQPIVRRFGGVPAVGGHHSGNRGRGRMWGRTREGLIVPRRFAA